jgi:hypothetical protein
MEKTMRWQWGPPLSPLKIKNKEEKIYFYGMTRATFYFHKPEYLIFMKKYFLEKTYTWSVYTCRFSAKNSFYFGL